MQFACYESSVHFLAFTTHSHLLSLALSSAQFSIFLRPMSISTILLQRCPLSTHHSNAFKSLPNNRINPDIEIHTHTHIVILLTIENLLRSLYVYAVCHLVRFTTLEKWWLIEIRYSLNTVGRSLVIVAGRIRFKKYGKIISSLGQVNWERELVDQVQFCRVIHLCLLFCRALMCATTNERTQNLRLIFIWPMATYMPFSH